MPAWLTLPPPVPQVEFDKLEADIEGLTVQSEALNGEMQALAMAGAEAGDIEAVALRLAEVAAQMEAKETRWLELAELGGV